jgi:transketolase
MTLNNPSWPDRDRLVLSNGHICPVYYATMAHAGYFPVEECKTLRKLVTFAGSSASRIYAVA